MPRWPHESSTADQDAQVRKELRRKVALMTGYQQMIREAREDMDELFSAIDEANGNGNRSTPGIRGHNVSQPLLPASSESSETIKPKRQYTKKAPRGNNQSQSTEDRSQHMKNYWARRKALGMTGKGGKLPDKKPFVAEPLPPIEVVAPPETGYVEVTPIVPEQTITDWEAAKARREAVQEERTDQAQDEGLQPAIAPVRKVGKKGGSPAIGFGTNAEYIYEYAAAHDGLINISEASDAAAGSATHNNLTGKAGKSRLTVALAEAKRKGFLVNQPGIGNYKLTPKAYSTYKRERAEAAREAAKQAKTKAKGE